MASPVVGGGGGKQSKKKPPPQDGASRAVFGHVAPNRRRTRSNAAGAPSSTDVLVAKAVVPPPRRSGRLKIGEEEGEERALVVAAQGTTKPPQRKQQHNSNSSGRSGNTISLSMMEGAVAVAAPKKQRTRGTKSVLEQQPLDDDEPPTDKQPRRRRAPSRKPSAAAAASTATARGDGGGKQQQQLPPQQQVDDPQQPMPTKKRGRGRPPKRDSVAQAMKKAAPLAAKRQKRDNDNSNDDSRLPLPKRKRSNSLEDTSFAAASVAVVAANVARTARGGGAAAASGQQQQQQQQLASYKPPTHQQRGQALLPPTLIGSSQEPQEHSNLVLTAFDARKFTAGLSIHDRPNENFELEAPHYAADIFQRLYEAEKLSSPQRYMEHQTHLSSTMRAILVDWIVEVHMKFRCEPETLYLAVNILDRYSSTVQIPRKTFQLVGVTALYLAAKYEEIYPPEVKDCVYTSNRAFSRQDVLDMESDILNELDFHLTVPTGLQFVRRFLLVCKASVTMCYAAHYYLERMLQEDQSLDYRPSLLAAAAVCLAINHPEIREHDGIQHVQKPGVHKDLIEYTGYSASVIYPVAEFVAGKCAEISTTQQERSLDTVKKKYSASQFQYISEDFAVPDAIDLLQDEEVAR